MGGAVASLIVVATTGAVLVTTPLAGDADPVQPPTPPAAVAVAPATSVLTAAPGGLVDAVADARRAAAQVPEPAPVPRQRQLADTSPASADDDPSETGYVDPLAGADEGYPPTSGEVQFRYGCQQGYITEGC